MELSVQEIIAKVAIQRQKEKHIQKQQQIIKQINSKSSHIGRSRVDRSENSLNLHKKQAKDSGNTLTTKYKDLQAIYKKLKIQISTELKMDQKYNEIMQQLAKVIKKNTKLQAELDGLRMKRSVIDQSEQSLNDENEKRNKSRKRIATEYVEKSNRMIKSPQLIKYNFCNDCAAPKCVQKDDIQTQQNQRKSKNKVKKTNISQKQRQTVTNQKNPYSKGAQDLDIQIQKYKAMIGQKQFSINKLQSIAQKQQQIIQSYKPEQRQVQVKAGVISSKIKSVKQPSQKKVQGTIVKVRREKQGKSGGELANKAITDRRQMFSNDYYKFSSPAYMQHNEQQTRKKPDTNSHTIGPVIAKTPAQPYSQSYTIMQSFPSQQQSHPNPHYYYRAEFESPSSINQTSEFVCGELQ